MSDIDAIMAVPSDIAHAVEVWRDANAKTMYPGGSPEEKEAERVAWLAIGTAIDEHAAEKVADAIRLERGGCTFCPAPAGGPHKMDCRRPSAGVGRLVGDFKP